METTVKLQEPFSYAIWPIIAAGIIAAVALAWFISIVLIKAGRKKKNIVASDIKMRQLSDIPAIKAKYIAELNKMENELDCNKISIRAAYQKMSVCIRRFTYEMTGIKVSNYTLQDIRKLNMPILEELIAEYYTPEFSKRSVGNVRASIEKTKRVIERWN